MGNFLYFPDNEKSGGNPARNQDLIEKRVKMEGFGRAKYHEMARNWVLGDIFFPGTAYARVRLQRVCPIATAEGNPLL